MLKNKIIRKATPIAFAIAAVLSTSAHAALVDITVSVENLAQENGVTFAPLRLGFHNGTFDSFDNNSVASAAIVSIAEGGSGSEWFPAFAAADPAAVLGTVANGGPAVPLGNAGLGNGFNSTASATFRVDSSTNQFFSFANMVVPSNDLFLANDDPIRLFDDVGNLIVNDIFQTGASIWDANSEVANANNGAFVAGGDNSARIAENGLVAFDFSELSVFDGLTTAAGYAFDFATVNADSDIYRISFSVEQVPVSAPSMIALFALGFIGLRYRTYKKTL
jgi:hypothetical protein